MLSEIRTTNDHLGAALERIVAPRPDRQRRRGSAACRSSERLCFTPQFQLAVTAYTGGSRVVTSNHVAPASPEPNTSPVVEPK